MTRTRAVAGNRNSHGAAPNRFYQLFFSDCNVPGTSFGIMTFVAAFVVLGTVVMAIVTALKGEEY